MVADNVSRGIEHNGSSMIMGEWTSNSAGGAFGMTDTANTAMGATARQVAGVKTPDVNTSYVQNSGEGGANYFKPSSPVGEGERPKRDVGNVDSLLKKN
jgi:hypothetical protein